MKKMLTSILFLALCTILSGQTTINISGTITNANGTGAEGVFIFVNLLEADIQYFTETDAAGNYEFQLEPVNGAGQGCFELGYIDCTFDAEVVTDCYNPGNYDFNFDFVYCENGTDQCLSFIVVDSQDSAFLQLFVESFGNAPFTYEWSDGSTDETLTLPLDATGEYCVAVTDSEGCVSEACIDLSPPDPCFVIIFPEYNFNSLVLYAEGFGQTDSLEYVWSTGESGQSIEITESGEYCVTLTDGLGCESFECGYFEVDTTWTQDCFSYIYSTYETDSAVETLVVESFGVAPFTYVWTFGDSIVSTTNSYIPNDAGVYCVTVTDAEECVYTFCYDYFVWEDCGVWLSCDPTPTGVELWAFGYGAEPITYVWSNGDEGQSIIVTENGEYCVTITDAEGCSSSACMDVNMDVSECFAPIEITEFPDYAELTVNPVTDGQYEFYWTTGEVEPSIVVNQSGTYCVEGIEIETGCTFTTCVTVFIGNQDCFGGISTIDNGDSTVILTVFAVDMSNDSLNFQYLWSTGETTESIVVTEVGEYCVTVTGSNNCVFETCTEVLFWSYPWQNSIFGAVYGSDTGEPEQATVDIYSISDDGSLELYSEGNQTLATGFFAVENVEPGSYIALAVADQDGYAPTYGFSTTSWESATIYNVGDDVPFSILGISMIPITNLQGGGTGSIEGSVSTDNLVANTKDSDTRNGTPLEDANILLTHSDIHVGHMFTNDEGQFQFMGLPYGTYKVILEIPGHQRKIIEVTLSEDNPNVTGVEFETEDASTATENISALSSLTLSPNPTSNILAVNTYLIEAKEMTYSVVDINGRIIQKSTFSANIGENNLQIDVAMLDNGVYHLVLQSKEEIITKRFVKL